MSISVENCGWAPIFLVRLFSRHRWLKIFFGSSNWAQHWRLTNLRCDILMLKLWPKTISSELVIWKQTVGAISRFVNKVVLNFYRRCELASVVMLWHSLRCNTLAVLNQTHSVAVLQTILLSFTLGCVEETLFWRWDSNAGPRKLKQRPLEHKANEFLIQQF